VPSEPVARESRRSTRVRLKVLIEVQSVTEPLTCEGETIVVNLHGALVMTAVALRVGMKVSIRVHITDKSAAAEVVYVDPDQPRHCGIKLAKAEARAGRSEQVSGPKVIKRYTVLTSGFANSTLQPRFSSV